MNLIDHLRRYAERMAPSGLGGQGAGLHPDRRSLLTDAANEIERQAAETASLRADLKQALRQWAMYAEMVERNDGFEFEKEKSPEADMYRAIKARISEQEVGP